MPTGESPRRLNAWHVIVSPYALDCFQVGFENGRVVESRLNDY